MHRLAIEYEGTQRQDKIDGLVTVGISKRDIYDVIEAVQYCSLNLFVCVCGGFNHHHCLPIFIFLKHLSSHMRC